MPHSCSSARRQISPSTTATPIGRRNLSLGLPRVIAPEGHTSAHRRHCGGHISFVNTTKGAPKPVNLAGNKSGCKIPAGQTRTQFPHRTQRLRYCPSERELPGGRSRDRPSAEDHPGHRLHTPATATPKRPRRESSSKLVPEDKFVDESWPHSSTASPPLSAFLPPVSSQRQTRVHHCQPVRHASRATSCKPPSGHKARHHSPPAAKLSANATSNGTKSKVVLTPPPFTPCHPAENTASGSSHRRRGVPTATLTKTAIPKTCPTDQAATGLAPSRFPHRESTSLHVPSGQIHRQNQRRYPMAKTPNKSPAASARLHPATLHLVSASRGLNSAGKPAKTPPVCTAVSTASSDAPSTRTRTACRDTRRTARSLIFPNIRRDVYEK